MTPEKLAKLPKWAQDHIQTLKRDVRFWKDRCMASEAGETRIWITHGFGAGEVRKYLPDDTITFAAGPDDRDVIDVRHDNSDEGQLYVYGGNGKGLLITPWSSNVCKIRLWND